MFKTAFQKKDRVVLSFIDEDGNPFPSMTEQHHKDGCNIDNILRQYDKTGLITHVNQAKADYGDYTEINEYQESLTLVMKAQDNFSSLPATIRAKFNYDPGVFLEFATDPKNHDEMVQLGLANAPIIQEEKVGNQVEKVQE